MTNKSNIYYKHTYYKIVMSRKLRKRSTYLNRHMELSLESRTLPKISPRLVRVNPFFAGFLPVSVDHYRECLGHGDAQEKVYSDVVKFDTVYMRRKTRKNITIGLLSYVISVLDQLEA